MMDMKDCYSDEGEGESKGKDMAELEALKGLKKFIASGWLDKYLKEESPELDAGKMTEEMADMPDSAPKKSVSETLMADGEEEENPLKKELMEYMKPKMKPSRPGTAVMIASMQKKPMMPMKKGSSKSKMV